MADLAYFLELFIFILPAYFANSTPVIFGGGTPVDFGVKLWDRRRLFGDGKTWRGLAAGFILGTAAGFVVASYKASGDYFVLAPLLAGGALLGDLLGSFIKRRMGMRSGQPSLFMDQLLFLFTALALAFPVLAKPSPPITLTPEGLVFLVILTYVLHVGANWLANRLGLKRVPW
ncbi:MAG: CDP-2,3-bis-(O-geranylgeranyl)-sn-glycerol synthase [Candidatus Micrarchaeia archaeon]